MGASQKSGAQVPKKWTWDPLWQGTWSTGWWVCKKKLKPCITPKPHFVLKREECPGKKIRLCFGFKFTITGNFRKHYLFQHFLKSDIFLVSLQMSCAKPYSSYTMDLSCWCFILLPASISCASSLLPWEVPVPWRQGSPQPAGTGQGPC